MIGRALQGRRGVRPWVVHLVYIVVALGLGFLIPSVPVGDTVSADTMMPLLLSVGTGIVGFFAVVFSLLFLVVQFGSTTLTPRLNLFRDSQIVWHAWGFFLGVLVFSFTAAYAISDEDETTVLLPIIVLTLLLMALTLFRILQTSAFNSIQLATALDQVVQHGGQVIDGVYPADVSEMPDPGTDPEKTPFSSIDAHGDVHEVRWPRRTAVLQVINVPRLVRIADEADVVIELRVVTGEVIFAGSVVARVHGRVARELDHDILKTFAAGSERTFEQDPAFPLRILSDIALRALSPAVNDPATAVQALDAMMSLLRVLVTRDLDVGRISNAHGDLRLVIPFPSWDDYLGLAIDEVTLFGVASPQVTERLERTLTDLAALAPRDRRGAVESRLQTVKKLSATDS